MAIPHQPPFIKRHGAQAQPAASGFNAMGQPIPPARRQAAYDACKAMGLSDRESMMRCVTGMAEQLERDKPFEAQRIAMQYVDLTGAYRLMATLLTDPDTDAWRAVSIRHYPTWKEHAMYTGHILDEINKLVAHAKWDDETLAELIEAFSEQEEPDLSALPELVDTLNEQGASAKQRVDAYLGDYFFGVSDEEMAILIHLAGALPERDMISLKEGDTVYWLDPGDHLGNGWYTITRIHADEEFPICDDTIINIRNEAGSEAEVPPYELR